MVNILISWLLIAKSGPPMSQCDEDELEMQAGSLFGSGEDRSAGNFTALVAPYEILLMASSSTSMMKQYARIEVCDGVTQI